MKQKRFALLLLLSAALLLSGCSAKKASVRAGRYRAVDPPTESGETVIQELTFEGSQVTMSGGSISQTVEYDIRDGQFTIKTRFGAFTYGYEEKEDGTLVIDGVSYVRK